MNINRERASLHKLVHCYSQKLSLPEVINEDGRNFTPTAYLESLATAREECPQAIVRQLDFLGPRCSLATAAAALLARLRLSGQVSDGREKLPVHVVASDDRDALRQLAQIYRQERQPPAEIRVRGQTISAVEFLERLRHVRDECPSPIAADVGLSHSPASVAEVAVSLLGRLRQRGAL